MKYDLTKVLKENYLKRLLKEDDDPSEPDPITGEFGPDIPGYGTNPGELHGEGVDALDRYMRENLGISLSDIPGEMRQLLLRLWLNGEVPDKDTLGDMFPESNVEEIQRLIFMFTMFEMYTRKPGVIAAMGPGVAQFLQFLMRSPIARQAWVSIFLYRTPAMLLGITLQTFNDLPFWIRLLQGTLDIVSGGQGNEDTDWLINYIRTYLRQLGEGRGFILTDEDIRNFNNEINPNRDSHLWILQYMLNPENPLVVRGASGRYYIYQRNGDGQWVLQRTTTDPRGVYGKPIIQGNRINGWHEGQIFINDSIRLNPELFEKLPFVPGASPTGPGNWPRPTIKGDNVFASSGLGQTRNPNDVGLGIENLGYDIA